MNPGSIAIRAAVAYAFTLLAVRLSGKRSIMQATPTDMVLALIIGDLFDDLFWAEVSAAQFVVAVGTLVTMRVLASAATLLTAGHFARSRRNAG